MGGEGRWRRLWWFEWGGGVVSFVNPRNSFFLGPGLACWRGMDQESETDSLGERIATLLGSREDSSSMQWPQTNGVIKTLTVNNAVRKRGG